MWNSDVLQRTKKIALCKIGTVQYAKINLESKTHE